MTTTTQSNSNSFQINQILVEECEFQYNSLSRRVRSVSQSGLLLAVLALSFLWLSLAVVELSSITGILFVVVVGAMIAGTAILWTKSVYPLRTKWEPAPTLEVNQCLGGSAANQLELYLAQYVSVIETNKALLQRSDKIWLGHAVSVLATMTVMFGLLLVMV